jgi:hypothetical protein
VHIEIVIGTFHRTANIKQESLFLFSGVLRRKHAESVYHITVSHMLYFFISNR